MFEEIKRMLVEEQQIKEEDIKPEAEFVNDLGFNSLEVAELIVLCEEKFDVELDEEVVHELVTVQDLVNYLETLQK